MEITLPKRCRIYHNIFEQRKMFLQEKVRNIRTHKEEGIDPFLTKIQEANDQLSVIGDAPQLIEIVCFILNSVSKEWQVFVQIILGRDNFTKWHRMWSYP